MNEPLKHTIFCLLPLPNKFCNLQQKLSRNAALFVVVILDLLWQHHKKDPTCFVCKNPTLGVFKPSVEIKNKIAKMRENMKPQGLYISSLSILSLFAT